MIQDNTFRYVCKTLKEANVIRDSGIKMTQENADSKRDMFNYV